MLKITFGKTRYNADKLLLNEANNTLELGNGYIMTNLSPNTKLADFVAYINKQYHLGDNIINAEIWYSRNGGSETEENFKVEKIVVDEEAAVSPSTIRTILVDGENANHYGCKVLDVDSNSMLFMTPRSIVSVSIPANTITITKEELEKQLAEKDQVDLQLLAQIATKQTDVVQDVSSKTFSRLG